LAPGQRCHRLSGLVGNGGLAGSCQCVDGHGRNLPAAGVPDLSARARLRQRPDHRVGRRQRLGAFARYGSRGRPVDSTSGSDQQTGWRQYTNLVSASSRYSPRSSISSEHEEQLIIPVVHSESRIRWAQKAASQPVLPFFPPRHWSTNSRQNLPAEQAATLQPHPQTG